MGEAYARPRISAFRRVGKLTIPSTATMAAKAVAQPGLPVAMQTTLSVLQTTAMAVSEWSRIRWHEVGRSRQENANADQNGKPKPLRTIPHRCCDLVIPSEH